MPTGRKGAPTRTAFNPALSADGRIVAFEATDAGRNGAPSRNGLWVVDRKAKRERLVTDASRGAAYLPEVAGDGRAVAYTSAELDNNGLTHVYLTSLKSGRTSLVSRADGAQGRAGGGRRVRAERLARRPLRGLHEPRAQPRRRRPRRHLRARPATRDDPARDRRDQGRRRRAVAVRRRPLRRLRRARRAPERHRRRACARRSGATTWRPARTCSSAARPARAACPPTATRPTPRSPQDGLRVAFASTASNLAEAKPDGIAGVFVRDLARNTTTLLSTHARRPGSDETPVAYLAAAGVALPLAFGAAGFFLFRRRRPFAAGVAARLPPRARRITSRQACRTLPSRARGGADTAVDARRIGGGQRDAASGPAGADLARRAHPQPQRRAAQPPEQLVERARGLERRAARAAATRRSASRPSASRRGSR